MKLFNFNPNTGKMDLIGNSRRGDWCGESIDYLVGEGRLAPIPCHVPFLGSDAEVTVHRDAGFTDGGGNDVSLRHESEWRIFCVGQWTAGETSHWEWWILPSAQALRAAYAEVA